MASLTIRPGSRVRLKGQEPHVPDFLVVRCDRDRCWIRQQNWGPEAQLNVRFTQLLVPDDGVLSRAISAGLVAPPLSLAAVPVNPPPEKAQPEQGNRFDNVVYMAAYRRKLARRP